MKKKNVYKLFGTELLITDTYREQMGGHLNSWNTLHEYLVSEPDEIDLMKLIVMEREGKSRDQLISRLHSALMSAKRRRQQAELGLKKC